MPAGLPFDLPLWDLIARRAGQPVYKLAAALRGKSLAGQLRVPCYDTSLYIDDLHLADDDAAAALIADEVLLIGPRSPCFQDQAGAWGRGICPWRLARNATLP